MTIGILGGSFNPIHNGHLQIAKNLITQKIVDEVWLLPCYSHVWNKELASAFHRTKMIDIAIDKLKIENCKLEVSQGKPMYTIDTVKLLFKKYPKDNFLWIIGSDNFTTLHKWHKIDELLDLIPFIIVPRTKDNYSSTAIRQRLKQGASIKNLVPPPVEKYIIDNKIYS